MRTNAKLRENLKVKVIDFGTIRKRKRICDFLLVINSNYGPILHCFWDTATYWLKIASYLAPPLLKFPLEFHGEVNREKTRIMGLLCGESCMIVTSCVFDWSTHMTDGRTGDSI